MKSHGVRFVVLATQRSGSTWVAGVLDGLPGVSVHGELFLPQVRRESQGWNPDSDYPRFIERVADRRSIRPFSVFSYLDSLYSAPGPVGFKLMYSHVQLFPEVVLYLLRHRLSVVHLVRRNVLDISISQAFQVELGRAHLRAEQTAPQNLKVRLEPDQLISQLERIRHNQARFRRALSLARLRHVEIAYEDLLRDEQEFRRIWKFLGVGAEWEMPEAKLTRIRTGTHRETLSNYEEVKAALSDTVYAEMLG